jgi:alpha/beta superfamily hydrolase
MTGAGGSQDDVAAAAAWLAQRHSGPLALIGYSFGALAGTVARLPTLVFGILMAAALALDELPPWPQYTGPLLLIAGDNDEFFALVPAVAAHASGLDAHNRMLTMEGVDHFFWSLESALEKGARRLVVRGVKAGVGAPSLYLVITGEKYYTIVRFWT